MAKRKPAQSVSWHLPAKNGGFARRPFFTTPQATADLVSVLAEDGLTWGELEASALFDRDARLIGRAFTEAGFGAVAIADHVR